MKPSWGKTIGVFFLCWTLAFLSCVLVSMFAGHSQGFSSYSTGGVSVLVAGFVCAAVYRSSGKAAGVAIGSIAFGAFVGLLAVFLASLMFVGQTVSAGQPNHSGKTTASTTMKSGSESDVSKPSSEDYIETSIEDPAALIDSPLAKSYVAAGRDAERWNTGSVSDEIAYKRITFGQCTNWEWSCPAPEDEMTFTDLSEILYVALAEMLDDPERARELINNPNVSVVEKEVSGKLVDYIYVWDTFETDGKQYIFKIMIIADADTRSQKHSYHTVDINNHFFHVYGEPFGRLQDLGWSVFYS